MKSILIKNFIVAGIVIAGISLTLHALSTKSTGSPAQLYSYNNIQTAPTGTKDSTANKSHTGTTGYTGRTGSNGAIGLTGATGTPAPSGPGKFDDKTPPKK